MSSEVSLFFNRIIRICLLAAASIGIVFFNIRPDSEGYFAGSLRQIELLKKISGRRIILVGGSNVAYGMDAELMQKELGIPVINDGLHAELGVLPLLELEQYIHEGDVIIVSLEYDMFSSRSFMYGGPAFLSDWIEVESSRARYLSNPFVEIPHIYTVMLQRKVNRSVEYVSNGGTLHRSIFISTNFDANGDFIGHLNLPSLAQDVIPSTPYPVWPLPDDIFVFLGEFDQTARAKGAQVYFEAPASRQVNCDITGKTRLMKFFDTFQQRLSIPILTPLDQVCVPDEYFLDTPYHLNAEGRELRTQRLIEDLKRVLTISN